HRRAAVVDGHAEIRRAWVEVVVGARRVQQQRLGEEGTAEPQPERQEAALRARQPAGACAVAGARTGTVVIAVAVLAGFADAVAAYRRIAAEDGRRQLIGPGSGHARDQHVPGAGGREEELAVAMLAGAGGAAVVVVGRGSASGLHVQVEVRLAVVDGIERHAELVHPGRHVDGVRTGGSVVTKRGPRLHDGGPRVTRRRYAAARRVAKAGAALRLDPGEIRGNARVEGEVA